MAKNLRYFETNAEYQAANLVFPSVSYVEDIDKVIYEPREIFKGKWLATYSNSTTRSATCDASSAITQYEIVAANCVEVEIGDCVTSIGYGAFWGFTGLTSINIPNSVTSIGQKAFNYCSSITSIDIPSGVTTIDTSTFNFCSGLTSIDIPSGVTSIGMYAFNGCISLTSVTVNATTPPTLGLFAGIPNCPIYVPSQSVEAYKTAQGWSDYASRIYPIS